MNKKETERKIETCIVIEFNKSRKTGADWSARAAERIMDEIFGPIVRGPEWIPFYQHVSLSWPAKPGKYMVRINKNERGDFDVKEKEWSDYEWKNTSIIDVVEAWWG
jgi:hypothetical protein